MTPGLRGLLTIYRWAACKTSLAKASITVMSALLGRAAPRGATPLRRLPAARGKPATVYAVRIPGWPGGGGMFIGDGETFVVARLDEAAAADRGRRPYWRPLRLAGHWQRDEWDGGWLQVEAIEVL